MRKPDAKRLNHAIDALMVAFLPMLMAYILSRISMLDSPRL